MWLMCTPGLYRKGKWRVVAMAAFSAFVSSSCATIISGARQRVTFESEPSGAWVHVEGYPDVRTPGSLYLSRKNSYVVRIEQSGYQEQRIPIACDLNYVAFLNILIGGIPGLLVDAFDGAMGELKPEAVNVNLAPIGELAGPTKRADESNVSQ